MLGYWLELVSRVQTGFPEVGRSTGPSNGPAPPDFLRQHISREPGPQQVLDAASLLWTIVASPSAGKKAVSTLPPTRPELEEGPEQTLATILADKSARYWPEKRTRLLHEYLDLCRLHNLRLPDWYHPDVQALLPPAPSPAAPSLLYPPNLAKLLVRLARRAVEPGEGASPIVIRPFQPDWYQGRIPESLLLDPPADLGKLSRTHRHTLAILAHVPAEQWFPPRSARRSVIPQDDFPLIWALGQSFRRFGPDALLPQFLGLLQNSLSAQDLFHQTAAFRGFSVRPLSPSHVSLLKNFFAHCTDWSPGSAAHEILSHLVPLPASLLPSVLRDLALELGRHGSLPLSELMEHCALVTDLSKGHPRRLPAFPVAHIKEFPHREAALSAWEAANSLLLFRMQMTDAFAQRRAQGIPLA